ncbi:MAG: SCO family protein [Rhodothermales bacterium]|nr:SCO family protein [Rhodothermales bacterium]MCA0269066.1 SCO family protein [Bacteroidota bacterium]
MPRLLPLVFALVALVGCRTDQTFDVQGRIVGFGQDGRTVIVAHEDIPGFMDAMTMPFKTKDGERVPDSLSVGDAVAFRLVVGGTASFIEALHRIPDDAVARMPGEPLPEAEARATGPVLAVGDTVGHLALTDHTGQRFDLADYAGKAVVMDFIYTSCPLPDYCPRLSAMMQAMQAPLAERFGDRVRLVTVSFDPARDTPDVLAAYRRRYTTSPADAWRFAAPDTSALAAMAHRFGLNLNAGSSGSWDHTLVTMLVGPDGVLRRVWRTADVTPAAMATEVELVLR